MSKLMQGSLATIKAACRRPIWEEPNLQYDGTEPPKGWLDRLKQLRQIHGYNDKEIAHIAERCMKGSAQVWFRIHRPKSFEALRTGLHTRFASGPVVVPTTAPPRSSLLDSIFSAKSNMRKFSSVDQWDVATNSSLPNRPELVAKPSPVSDEDAQRYCCNLEFTSKTTRQSQESRGDPNSTATLVQRKSGVASSASDHVSVRNNSSKYRTSAVHSTIGNCRNAKRNTENGTGLQGSKVFQTKSLSDAKNKMEIRTFASSSIAREGDDYKVKGAKGMDATSISLSNMSCQISAKDVLREDGSKTLPASCKTLPMNWQEALMKFKHAIHLAMRGNWTQMSSDFCKYYLRCYRMRTSGSKRELVHRIRDHLELTDGSGAQKYPRSSFVIDCAGDVILFEQKLRTGFDVLNGNQSDSSIRTVVGRVVKDFKSTSSQQDVFTVRLCFKLYSKVEVYWSRGQQAFRPMRPLLITARDLFSLHPLRQRWINENARKGLLDEKRNTAIERKASYGVQVAAP